MGACWIWKKCKVCKKKFWGYHSRQICEDLNCRLARATTEGRKKYARQNHRRARGLVVPHLAIIDRPWTDLDIDNLWYDYCKGRLPEYTARQTRRSLGEVIEKTLQIEQDGFEAVYIAHGGKMLVKLKSRGPEVRSAQNIYARGAYDPIS
jgi:hypothetical protein